MTAIRTSMRRFSVNNSSRVIETLSKSAYKLMCSYLYSFYQFSEQMTLFVTISAIIFLYNITSFTVLLPKINRFGF